MAKTTKKAKTKSGGMSAAKRDSLESSKFAFPKERKEPLNDAKHVRNAIARFGQVKDVSRDERNAAWKRIKRAAKKFDVEVSHRPKVKTSKKGKRKTAKRKTAKGK